MRRLLLSMLLSVFAAVSIAAQTTAFSYQGSLKDGANPANGNYDFEFKLFDLVSTGTQQGSTVQRLNVAVANGVFAVSLDFGAGTLPGADRFLEIAVRTAGGSAFTQLTPRQKVNSSPYSVKSLNAANADNATSAANAANATTAATATNALQLGGVAAANYLQTNGNGSGLTNLNAGNISTGTLAIANGGTGAANAANARANLGLGPLSTVSPTGTPGPATFLRGDNTWASSATEIVASINTQFSQDDRANWTHIEMLPDDGCNTGIPLGFTFTGWGLNVTAVGVNNNGFLIFGNTCPTTGSWNNSALPNPITSDPFVAFFWDDLNDFGTGEFIEYQTSGTTGGRVFNMLFRNRLLNGCVGDAVNIMLAIHEGSNLVRISYSNMSGCAEMRGSSATFGMQGPGGAAARVFNAGANSPILDNDANRNMISFIPPKQ